MVTAVEGTGLRTSGFAENPYPHYARLREAGPMHRTAEGDWWAVDYATATQVLSDHRLIKGTRERPEIRLPPGFGHLPPLEPSMLMQDPPAHTRLRTLVNRAFNPGAVQALRPRIASLADTLLDRVQARGHMDLIADFAGPLPATVIAELLGVPSEDQRRFRRWSDALVRVLDPSQPEPARLAGLAAQLQLVEYFHNLLGRRRGNLRPGLLATLAEAEQTGDRLSAGEVLVMAMLLLTAGHETTTHLIGTGTLVLLEHPNELARLQGNPELVPTAVEELLRFAPPVHLDRRIAAVDLELGGQQVHAGERVVAVIGSANRDGQVWPDPDRLDVARHPNPHLAFGRGIHFCLGAPLARLEGQIALAALLRRLPGLALDPGRPPEWNGNVVLRGMRRFGVRWA